MPANPRIGHGRGRDAARLALGLQHVANPARRIQVAGQAGQRLGAIITCAG
jgi:hypothetical protein